MKPFKWISTQEQWDSAIAALLLLDLPLALLDDGDSDYRCTIVRAMGTDSVAVIQERSDIDARGGKAWSQSKKTFFDPSIIKDPDSGFGRSTFEVRALLSLALHAASANCTDDDGEPYTLDGVTTAHLDDLDLSCSLDGMEWTLYPTSCVVSLTTIERGVEMARVRQVESGKWVALVRDHLPSVEQSCREAMTDAEVTIIEDPGRRHLKRDNKPAIEVVDVIPTASHEERQAKCVTMILNVSADTLVDIETHLAAIVEVEASE